MAARQLILDLLARDKTGPAAKSAAGNLEDVGEAAEDAAKSTEKLGKEADKAEDQAEKLGKSSRTAAQHIDKLDREIESVEKELRQLAVAFAEAETAADRVDLSKAIRRTQRDLKDLQKNRGKLTDLLPDVGKGFGQSIVTALNSTGPQVKVALVAGVAAAAPFVGAALTGAIVGGLSAGVVAGGIALVAKDPQVAAAGKQLGSRLLGNLEDDAEVFIGPVLTAVDKIGDRFDELRPRFRRIFANASQFVEPLTEGLLDGVDGLTRGIDVLVANGRPAIEALADTFDELGTASGDALAVIAGGSEDGARGLQLLGDLAGSSIRSLGASVRGLTEAFGAAAESKEFVSSLLGLSDAAEDADQKTTGAATAADGLNQNLTLMAMKAAGAEGPITTLSTQINEFTDASRDAFSAATNVGAALDEATAAAKENGATLDANTEKGRANRQALSNLANAMIAAYNAEVALNGEGEKANAVANRSREQFIRLATALTGSRQRAKELADALGLIKAPPPINIKDNFASAKARAKAIQTELDRLPRTVPVRVIVTRAGEITYGSGGGRQAPQGRASGGRVTRGTPYIVGEKRPELFIPETNGYVHPSVGQSAAGRAAAGGMAGVAVVPSGALDEIERLFLKMVRTRPAFRAALIEYLA